MKNSLLYLFLSVFTVQSLFAQDAKIVSECTVVYDITLPKEQKLMEGTTKVLYIKGTKSRTDLVSPNYLQTVIYNSKTDSSVILRELGNAKYITYLDSKKQNEKNKKFEGMTLTYTGEKKTILGYECKQAIAKLTDGTTFSIFFASSIIPSVKQYEFQFKDIPGFVLEYEALSEDGKTKLIYGANQITFTPVLSAKFDLPKSGYRIL